MRHLRSVLVAGGAGFVGSSLVRHLLAQEQVRTVVVLDTLTGPGGRQNLAGPDHDPRFILVEGDLADRAVLASTLRDHEVTAVFNLVTEDPPGPAPGASLVTGTALLLEACREAGLPLVQASTTAVYGSIAPPSKALESDRPSPTGVPAALHAAADLLCLAASARHGQDVLVTRASNNYGPRQPASRFIPTLVRHALRDEPITLHGGGMRIRDWIHVDDHCRGLLAAFHRGRPGHIYHFGGHCERTALGLARHVLRALGKPESLLVNGPERQGGDLRRAVDTTQAQGFLGWQPRAKMAEALPGVIRAIAADL